MKGFLGKFMIVLIMLGMFSLLFIALDQAYDVFFEFAQDQVTDAGSSRSITIVDIMWTWLPVGVLFSFIVWAITKPRKEREVAFA